MEDYLNMENGNLKYCIKSGTYFNIEIQEFLEINENNSYFNLNPDKDSEIEEEEIRGNTDVDNIEISNNKETNIEIQNKDKITVKKGSNKQKMQVTQSFNFRQIQYDSFYMNINGQNINRRADLKTQGIESLKTYDNNNDSRQIAKIQEDKLLDYSDTFAKKNLRIIRNSMKQKRDSPFRSSKQHTDLNNKNNQKNNHKNDDLSFSESLSCNELSDTIYQNDEKIKSWIHKLGSDFIPKLTDKGYSLIKFINKGGECEVYKGLLQNQNISRQFVAIKIYQDIGEENISEMVNIMKELQFEHNIIQYIDHFEISNCFILIEELANQSLMKQLHQFKSTPNNFTEYTLIQIIFDLLDGLIQLRLKNIIHFDIKPLNILFTKDYCYVYTDFGISQKYSTNKEMKVLGLTMKYASPEQKQKQTKSSQINFKSDIYSLGKTLKDILNTYIAIKNNGVQIEIIDKLNKIIDENMIQEIQLQRNNCFQLYLQFTKVLLDFQNKEIIWHQYKKIKQFINSDNFEYIQETREAYLVYFYAEELFEQYLMKFRQFNISLGSFRKQNQIITLYDNLFQQIESKIFENTLPQKIITNLSSLYKIISQKGADANIIIRLTKLVHCCFYLGQFDIAFNIQAYLHKTISHQYFIGYPLINSYDKLGSILKNQNQYNYAKQCFLKSMLMKIKMSTKGQPFTKLIENQQIAYSFKEYKEIQSKQSEMQKQEIQMLEFNSDKIRNFIQKGDLSYSISDFNNVGYISHDEFHNCQDLIKENDLNQKSTKQQIMEVQTNQQQYQVLLNWEEVFLMIPNDKQCKLLKKKKDKLIEKFQQNSYFLTKYIARGGQGLVFEGSDLKNKQVFAIKILFNTQNNEELQTEIKIMQLLKNNRYFVSYIKHIEIDNETQVIILEKCENSLECELQNIAAELFTEVKLFKIIFDLLDGLILLRQYKILHLDVKPANILLSKENNYLYADFGLSDFLRTQNKTIKARGYTKFYAPQEQIKTKNGKVDHRADIHALGKTLEKIIKQYKLKKQGNYNQQLIDSLENIINNSMIANKKQERLDSSDLHKLIWKTIFSDSYNYQEFLKQYIDTVININENQFQQQDNKDIPYSSQIQLYYSKLQLKLKKYFNSNSEDTINSIAIVARNYHNIGKYEKSLRHYIQYYINIKSIFGKAKNTKIAFALYQIGQIYIALGELDIARQYSYQSLKIRETYFSSNLQEIAESYEQLGVITMALNQLEKAYIYLNKSFSLYKKQQNNNHLSLASILNNLSIFYSIKGDYKGQDDYIQGSFTQLNDKIKIKSLFLANLYQTTGNHFYEIGNYKEALNQSKKSFKDKQKILVNTHPEFTSSFSNLGKMYNCLGDSKSALYFCNISISEQISNKNSIIKAINLNNQGIVYSTSSQFQQSLKLTRKAYEIVNEKIKNDRLEAILLNNIGIIQSFLGEFSNAKKNLKNVQYLKEFGENHPKRSIYSFNLGCMYFNKNKFNKANKYFQDSLDQRKTVFEKYKFHPNIASSHNSMGCLLTKTGDYKKANDHLIQCIQIRKQLYRNQPHPDTAQIHNNLGIYHYLNGQIDLSINYYYLSVNQYQQLYSGNNLQIASVLNNQGVVYLENKDFSAAQICFLQSYQMLDLIFNSDNHPILASSLNNYGFVLFQSGYQQKGIKYMLRSLAMRKSLFKEPHSDIASSYQRLALIYYCLNDFEIAILYSQKSLEIKQQIYEKTHPEIAYSLNNMAQIYISYAYFDLKSINDDKTQNYLFKALQFQLQSIEMLKQIFKDQNNCDVAQSLYNLGCIYSYLGDNINALTYNQKSLNMFSKLGQSQLPIIKSCLTNIVYIFDQLQTPFNPKLYEVNFPSSSELKYLINQNKSYFLFTQKSKE